MSGQSIALATKGLLCKPGRVVERFIRQLNLNININPVKLNLEKINTKKLNLKLDNVKNTSLKLDVKTLHVDKDKFKLTFRRICND